MSETPLLCKTCQQWLVVSADRFCANCGQVLVKVAVTPQELKLTTTATPQSVTLVNGGWFPLYWAAEIVGLTTPWEQEFCLAPSYGTLLPDTNQTIVVTWLIAQSLWLKQNRLPMPRELSVQLLISSNATRTPEILLPIAIIASEAKIKK
jgi:hypothetical protein